MKQRLAAILVADVAGYSLLMGADEKSTVAALEERRAVFKSLIDMHAGRVVDTAGDSVLAIFESVTGSVEAAIRIQENVSRMNEALPIDKRMQFRIGLNLGDVLEQDDGSVYGDGINVAARIQSMAEPGGIYLSGSIVDSVRGRVSNVFEFLGEHKMKNIAHPVRTYRIVGSNSSKVSGSSIGAISVGNLPNLATKFIGRTKETSLISTALDHARCVTLTGVGGSGKTRLSVEVAAENASNYTNGAWICELAPVTVPEGVEHALANALRIDQRSGLSIKDTLLEVLKGRTQLLVMDNCEHLLGKVAELVSAILKYCPGVRVIATSREPLSIEGERIFPIMPLEVPAPASSRLLDQVSQVDSVRLFVDRAMAAQADFELTEENCQQIAEICRRLDGVPLAIELAAARVRSLAPSDILRRLNERFRFLIGGKRDADARHQTLRATIDWSYELLNESERELFCKLSIFVGGFYVDAAEAICPGDRVDADSILDILTSLADKSIVLIDRTSEGSRYRLLESFRQYGYERIAGSADLEVLRESHCRYYVEYAERGESQIRGKDELMWVNRFDADFDNLRAAFARTHQQGDVDASLRLCASLPLYGIFRLRFEPNGWAAAAADMPGAPHHPLGAYVAGYAAWGAWITGNFSDARHYVSRALEWEERFGSRRTWLPRHALMCLCFNEANMAQALQLADEQIAISRAVNDTVRVAHLLMAKSAYLSSLAGESQLALAQECEQVARAGGNPAVNSLGCYAMAAALAPTDPTRALAYIEECLAIARPIRYGWIIATVLTLQCTLLAQHGEPRDALMSASEAISVWYRAGDWSSQWRTIRLAIPPLVRGGAFLEAGTLSGLLQGKTFMGESPPGFEERISEALEACVHNLGPEVYDAARRRGEQLSDEEAIAYSLRAIRSVLAPSA